MRKRLCALAIGVGACVFATAAGAENYIVLYKGNSVSPGAANAIRLAGGTLLKTYGQIGVAIASSSNPRFAAKLKLRDASVAGTSGTTGFAVKLPEGQQDGQNGPTDTPQNTPVGNSDTLTPLQWDMRQIKAPEAHAITGGSRSVLVGDIDTGLDYTHPDLAANVDSANSVDCLGGVPKSGAAAAVDVNGHGTHTAGTIAAAANGIGIIGVAPNVRIAGIRAGNADGFFFPEAVVCAFVWAGSHHFDVTNNSYFADPYYFNCRNDPKQRAIWDAEQRAIRYAQRNGVTVVAAMGNFSDDLAHPTQDRQSPDDGTPVTRPVDESCIVIPTQIPGVIAVSATGSQTNKSYYSNYGLGVTDVAAPGGDRRQLLPGQANGRVLSTYPADKISDCLRPVIDPSGATYCWLQGTSMASPHVAGLAALAMSRFGHADGPEIQQLLQRTADPHACPTAAELAFYATNPSANNDAPQTCEGTTAFNGWYGAGIVNALAAITSGGNGNNENGQH